MKIEKEFKGNIIITDPYYIVHYKTGNPKEDLAYYLHTNNFICEDLFYGEWRYVCWKGHKIPRVEWGKNITSWRDKQIDYENHSDITYLMYDPSSHSNFLDSIYGTFCSDSGKVLIIDSDYVLTYLPNFMNWQLIYSRACTIISNFSGTVEYNKDLLFDGKEYIYLKGIGNKPFIASQI